MLRGSRLYVPAVAVVRITALSMMLPGGAPAQSPFGAARDSVRRQLIALPISLPALRRHRHSTLCLS